MFATDATNRGVGPTGLKRHRRGNFEVRWLLCFASILMAGLASAAETAPFEVRIVDLSGTVEISRAGATAWDPAYTNQVLRPGDSGRTGARGQVVLQLRDRSLVRYGDRSHFAVEAPASGRESVLMELIRGVGYFFGRDRPDAVRFRSRTASAAVRGTEFVIAVDDDDRMVVTLLDGEVELRNDAGVANLSSGEQGVAEPGKAPAKSPVLDAAGALQWLLYYPGVLDPNEAGLSSDERSALSASLESYRAGDLKQALALYPAGRIPSTTGEQIYFAALLPAARWG